MKTKLAESILRLIGIVVLISTFSTEASYATTAAPGTAVMKQPDGNKFKVVQKGDEWSNWVETSEGYSIAQKTDGYWYYVKEYNGKMPVISSIYAHQKPSLNLQKHMQPTSRPSSLRKVPQAAALAQAPSGNFNGPVLYILTEFNNQAGTTTEASWASFINDNIADFYNRSSYGKVTLHGANESFGTSNNGVVGWVNVGYNHPNTNGNTGTSNQQLTRDAILAADPYVNFSAYDVNSDGYVDADELAIVVIVAGYEAAITGHPAPSVWAHKWSLQSTDVSAPVVDGVSVGDDHSGQGGYAQFGELHQGSTPPASQATMGVQVHELGHLIFGLPDLYDTDIFFSSKGVGIWCVMSAGSWGKSSDDTYAGETPVLPSAWVKYNRGWVDGNEGDGIESLTGAGELSAMSSNTVYKASTCDSPNEYFLIENRRPAGYDRGLERWLGTNFGGLAIFHIDDAQTSNRNDSHRWVDVEEADGDLDNPGQASDLWYQGHAITFDDVSIPASDQYNGAASNVAITNVSTAGTVMAANFASCATNTNRPPIVSITSPVDGTTFTEGEGIAISANASDINGSITLVEFFQGSTTLGDDNTAPYQFNWTSVAAGNYNLTAVATDNNGATTTSAAVNVYVYGDGNENTPPMVSITSPVDDTTFTEGDVIAIAANASDINGSITLVEFFQGSTELGDDNTAPYQFNWTGAAAGSYSLTAVATDNAGVTTTSTVVNITVDAANWQVITYDDFESGMGNYTDGGDDMSRYTDGTHAHQGSSAAGIQDNSGVASSFYHTTGHDVTNYKTLEIDFWFKMVSLEPFENFLVEYFDGSTWEVLAAYFIFPVPGATIVNNTFYNRVVTISSSSSNFPSNAQLRFRCDASDDGDDVYIDEIEFRGLVAGGNTLPVFTNDEFRKSNAMEGQIYIASIAGDATDPDGDELAFSKVSGPAWLSIAPNGDLSGTPASGDVGANQFTVRVEDGTGGRDEAIMYIRVHIAPHLHFPQFTNDEFRKSNAMEGQIYIASIAGDATDPDGDELTFSKVSGPAWLSIAPNGDLSGTPASSDVGASQFTVRVEDGTGGSDEAIMYIRVHAAGAAWTTLTFDDFESGWGSYVDGGDDCRRNAKDAAYAHQGTYCARIRDNTNTSIFSYGNGVDVTAYDDITISFWYYPRSMDNSNEDFWVQFYDGSAWHTVASYAQNVDFQNDNFYEVAQGDIIISSSSYSFSNNMQIRFVCDASGNTDFVYIDEIEIAARKTGSPSASATTLLDETGAVPTNFELKSNYPNPFNPTTTIGFSLVQDSAIAIKIYDTSGSLIKTLINDSRPAGNHSVVWNGLNDNNERVSSGVYIYRFESKTFTQARRMVLLK